jgi:hypothetical protein
MFQAGVLGVSAHPIEPRYEHQYEHQYERQYEPHSK